MAVKLADLTPNPDNPRVITPERLETLAASIQSFEAMMTLRPIVTDEAGLILGGNMRYQALLHLGYTEVPDDWVLQADDLTDQEKREFVIRDNNQWGAWDYQALVSSWADIDFESLHIDLPKWEGDEEYYQDKNRRLDEGKLADTVPYTLHFTLEEMEQVREGLAALDDKPEQALLKALELCRSATGA